MTDEYNPFGPIDLRRLPRALFPLDSLDKETLARMKQNPSPKVDEKFCNRSPENDVYASAPKIKVFRISLKGVLFKVEPEDTDLAANDATG